MTINPIDENINVENSNITSIDININSDYIQSINISHNHDFTNFQFLNYTPTLKYLYCDDCKIQTFDQLDIRKTTQLKYLVLRQNELNTFSGLKSHNNLEVLDVSLNNFSDESILSLNACFEILTVIYFGYLNIDFISNAEYKHRIVNDPVFICCSEQRINSFTLLQRLFLNRFYANDQIFFSDAKLINQSQIVLQNLQFSAFIDQQGFCKICAQGISQNNEQQVQVNNAKVIITNYQVLTGFNIVQISQDVVQLKNLTNNQFKTIKLSNQFEVERYLQIQEHYQIQLLYQLMQEQMCHTNFNVVTIEYQHQVGVFTTSFTNLKCVLSEQQLNQSGIKQNSNTFFSIDKQFIFASFKIVEERLNQQENMKKYINEQLLNNNSQFINNQQNLIQSMNQSIGPIKQQVTNLGVQYSKQILAKDKSYLLKQLQVTRINKKQNIINFQNIDLYHDQKTNQLVVQHQVIPEPFTKFQHLNDIKPFLYYVFKCQNLNLQTSNNNAYSLNLFNSFHFQNGVFTDTKQFIFNVDIYFICQEQYFNTDRKTILLGQTYCIVDKCLLINCQSNQQNIDIVDSKCSDNNNDSAIIQEDNTEQNKQNNQTDQPNNIQQLQSSPQNQQADQQTVPTNNIQQQQKQVQEPSQQKQQPNEPPSTDYIPLVYVNIIEYSSEVGQACTLELRCTVENLKVIDLIPFCQINDCQTKKSSGYLTPSKAVTKFTQIKNLINVTIEYDQMDIFKLFHLKVIFENQLTQMIPLCCQCVMGEPDVSEMQSISMQLINMQSKSVEACSAELTETHVILKTGTQTYQLDTNLIECYYLFQKQLQQYEQFINQLINNQLTNCSEDSIYYLRIYQLLNMQRLQGINPAKLQQQFFDKEILSILQKQIKSIKNPFENILILCTNGSQHHLLYFEKPKDLSSFIMQIEGVTLQLFDDNYSNETLEKIIDQYDVDQTKFTEVNKQLCSLNQFLQTNKNHVSLKNTSQQYTLNQQLKIQLQKSKSIIKLSYYVLNPFGTFFVVSICGNSSVIQIQEISETQNQLLYKINSYDTNCRLLLISNQFCQFLNTENIIVNVKQQQQHQILVDNVKTTLKIDLQTRLVYLDSQQLNVSTVLACSKPNQLALGSQLNCHMLQFQNQTQCEDAAAALLQCIK